MALLFPSSVSLFGSSPSPSPSSSSLLSPATLAVAASRSSRLESTQLNLQHGSFKSARISVLLTSSEKRSLAVHASEIDGIDGPEVAASLEEPKDAASIENLPSESKMQMKLEQKLKMKMAKKIRLRRKRLLRKRQMRKKGRWPPSKMKKLKNV